MFAGDNHAVGVRAHLLVSQFAVDLSELFGDVLDSVVDPGTVIVVLGLVQGAAVLVSEPLVQASADPGDPSGHLLNPLTVLVGRHMCRLRGQRSRRQLVIAAGHR